MHGILNIIFISGKEPKIEVNIICTLDSGLREINSLPELCTIIASYNSDSESKYKIKKLLYAL